MSRFRFLAFPADISLVTHEQQIRTAYEDKKTTNEAALLKRRKREMMRTFNVDSVAGELAAKRRAAAAELKRQMARASSRANSNNNIAAKDGGGGDDDDVNESDNNLSSNLDALSSLTSDVAGGGGGATTEFRARVDKAVLHSLEFGLHVDDDPTVDFKDLNMPPLDQIDETEEEREKMRREHVKELARFQLRNSERFWAQVYSSSCSHGVAATQQQRARGTATLSASSSQVSAGAAAPKLEYLSAKPLPRLSDDAYIKRQQDRNQVTLDKFRAQMQLQREQEEKREQHAKALKQQQRLTELANKAAEGAAAAAAGGAPISGDSFALMSNKEASNASFAPSSSLMLTPVASQTTFTPRRPSTSTLGAVAATTSSVSGSTPTTPDNKNNKYNRSGRAKRAAAVDGKGVVSTPRQQQQRPRTFSPGNYSGDDDDDGDDDLGGSFAFGNSPRSQSGSNSGRQNTKKDQQRRNDQNSAGSNNKKKETAQERAWRIRCEHERQFLLSIQSAHEAMLTDHARKKQAVLDRPQQRRNQRVREFMVHVVLATFVAAGRLALRKKKALKVLRTLFCDPVRTWLAHRAELRKQKMMGLMNEAQLPADIDDKNDNNNNSSGNNTNGVSRVNTIARPPPSLICAQPVIGALADVSRNSYESVLVDARRLDSSFNPFAHEGATWTDAQLLEMKQLREREMKTRAPLSMHELFASSLARGLGSSTAFDESAKRVLLEKLRQLFVPVWMPPFDLATASPKQWTEKRKQILFHADLLRNAQDYVVFVRRGALVMEFKWDLVQDPFPVLPLKPLDDRFFFSEEDKLAAAAAASKAAAAASARVPSKPQNNNNNNASSSSSFITGSGGLGLPSYAQPRHQFFTARPASAVTPRRRSPPRDASANTSHHFLASTSSVAHYSIISNNDSSGSRSPAPSLPSPSGVPDDEKEKPIPKEGAVYALRYCLPALVEMHHSSENFAVSVGQLARQLAMIDLASQVPLEALPLLVPTPKMRLSVRTDVFNHAAPSSYHHHHHQQQHEEQQQEPIIRRTPLLTLRTGPIPPLGFLGTRPVLFEGRQSVSAKMYEAPALPLQAALGEPVEHVVRGGRRVKTVVVPAAPETVCEVRSGDGECMRYGLVPETAVDCFIAPVAAVKALVHANLSWSIVARQVELFRLLGHELTVQSGHGPYSSRIGKRISEQGDSISMASMEQQTSSSSTRMPAIPAPRDLVRFAYSAQQRTRDAFTTLVQEACFLDASTEQLWLARVHPNLSALESIAQRCAAHFSTLRREDMVIIKNTPQDRLPLRYTVRGGRDEIPLRFLPHSLPEARRRCALVWNDLVMAALEAMNRLESAATWPKKAEGAASAQQQQQHRQPDSSSSDDEGHRNHHHHHQRLRRGSMRRGKEKDAGKSSAAAPTAASASSGGASRESFLILGTCEPELAEQHLAIGSIVEEHGGIELYECGTTIKRRREKRDGRALVVIRGVVVSEVINTDEDGAGLAPVPGTQRYWFRHPLCTKLKADARPSLLARPDIALENPAFALVNNVGSATSPTAAGENTTTAASGLHHRPASSGAPPSGSSNLEFPASAAAAFMPVPPTPESLRVGPIPVHGFQNVLKAQTQSVPHEVIFAKTSAVVLHVPWKGKLREMLVRHGLVTANA